jgi:hypothetical protein
MDTAQNLETIFTDLHIDPTYSLLSLIDKGLPQLLINCKLSKCISLLHYDNIASSLMDESTNQEDIAGMVGMNAQLESILSKYQERAVNVAICMQEIRAISYEMIISMFERGRPLAPEELENVNAFMSKLFDAAETDPGGVRGRKRRGGKGKIIQNPALTYFHIARVLEILLCAERFGRVRAVRAVRRYRENNRRVKARRKIHPRKRKRPA